MPDITNLPIRRIETLPSPDSPAKFEQGAEQAPERVIERRQEEPIRAEYTPPAPAPVVNAIQDEAARVRERQIEAILAEGLEQMYLGLTPEKRVEFKAKGEETARTINELLSTGKANLKKVVDLIIAWLTLIPGVNRFFLEQEAKIKADEIIDLTL
jgi:hypothetical protein